MFMTVQFAQYLDCAKPPTETANTHTQAQHHTNRQIDMNNSACLLLALNVNCEVELRFVKSNDLMTHVNI